MYNRPYTVVVLGETRPYKAISHNPYEVCPKSKCTDFPMYDLGTQHSLMYIGELIITLAASIYLFNLIA
jgi:hypothetical protein